MTLTADARPPAGGQDDPEPPLGRFTLDAVSLFLFSAACGLTHRIHYDEGYARREGFDGLPVQGPLEGALVAEAFHAVARRSGRRLAALQIRHLRPVCARQEFRLIHDAPRRVDAEGRARVGGKGDEIRFRLETGSGIALAAGTVILASLAPKAATA